MFPSRVSCCPTKTDRAPATEIADRPGWSVGTASRQASGEGVQISVTVCKFFAVPCAFLRSPCAFLRLRVRIPGTVSRCGVSTVVCVLIPFGFRACKEHEAALRFRAALARPPGAKLSIGTDIGQLPNYN